MAAEQVEATLTAFRTKLELQLNYRKIILNDQLNTHHHTETSRKCTGAKGLAGLSWMAAEIPKGYFSTEGFALRRVEGG